jgi:hypothetical protein|tara:strand:+ start:255 stop:374 length:120 start_codon:yes stop_codon:yes gene_type:complete
MKKTSTKKAIKKIIKNPHLWSPADVAYARMELRLRNKTK